MKIVIFERFCVIDYFPFKKSFLSNNNHITYTNSMKHNVFNCISTNYIESPENNAYCDDLLFPI